MIDQNTIRIINFRIFKFRMLPARDCVHAQLVALAFRAVYGNASITGFLDRIKVKYTAGCTDDRGSCLGCLNGSYALVYSARKPFLAI